MAGTVGDLPIQIQDRDLAVLRGFFESRLMTIAHASTLYFEGKEESAKKRLQKLKRAGLIAERRRRAFDPSILFLTQQGYQVLESHEALDGYPRLSVRDFTKRAQVSELTLRHELQVMDVKASFVHALRSLSDLTLTDFTTWPALCDFKAFRPDGLLVPTKPDGFIRIREATPEQDYEHCFFLEVDRSTEALETLVLKAACYTDHYLRGGFARRCGLDAFQYKQAPFRVLLVFKSVARRNNVAEALLVSNLPLRNLTWLTTAPELRAAPLGQVWVRLGDYDAVAAPLGFTSATNGNRSGSILDASVPRHSLFE